MSLAREPLPLPATEKHKFKPLQIKAARLIAEGGRTTAQVAALVNRSVFCVDDWKRDPQYRELIKQYEAEIDAAILESCKYARKVKRVQALDKHTETLDARLTEDAMWVYETVYDRTGNPMVDENGDLMRDRRFDKDTFNAFIKVQSEIAAEMDDRKSAGRIGAEVDDGNGRVVRFVVEMAE